MIALCIILLISIYRNDSSYNAVILAPGIYRFLQDSTGQDPGQDFLKLVLTQFNMFYGL